MVVLCCNENVWCCPLQRKKRRNQECEWWDIIIVKNLISVICQNFVLMVWCYFMFWFLFCRSECPIKISRWVLCEIICEIYLLLLCVCVIIKGVFSLHVFGLFSVRRRRRRGGSSGGCSSHTLPTKITSHGQWK